MVKTMSDHREIDSFDYSGFTDMPTEDVKWIKQAFLDPLSSRVELRVALWMLWWYSDDSDTLQRELSEEYYSVLDHTNLPNHPTYAEIQNVANGRYAGDLEKDVAVSKQHHGECYICERDNTVFPELQLQEHHTSYNPERTVLLCSQCHGSVHHKDGFFDELAPDRSREWLKYEYEREKSETSVQVGFDAF